MNILVVAYHRSKSSGSPSAIFVHNQAVAYSRLGCQVRVLCLIPVGKLGWDGHRVGKPVYKENIDGIEYYFMRYLSFSNFAGAQLNDMFAQLSLKLLCSRVIDGFRPDIIHAHTIAAPFKLGIMLKRHFSIPLVVTTHGTDTSGPYQKGLLYKYKCRCDQADCIIGVSKKLINALLTSGTTAKTGVILNGFAAQAIDDAEEKILGPTVIQVSNLIEQKGVQDTIAAFAQVKKIYSGASLTIVGKGPEKENFQKLAESLGVSDCVSFMGQLPNAAVLHQMSQHSFFVMPSVREGFGIVYLEAMASGCVTIGTQGEGIEDFIIHGENGYLVEPHSPEQIAQIILECMEHPEKATQIAMRGRRCALNQTWEKNAREYLSLFQRLIG